MKRTIVVGNQGAGVPGGEGRRWRCWWGLARVLGLGLLAAMPGGIQGVQAQPAAPVEARPRVERAAKLPRDWYPFRGEVAAVDVPGGKVHLKRKGGARPMGVEPATSLVRDGKAIRLDEIRIGEYLRGKVRKGEGGAEILREATVDAEPPAGRAGTAGLRRGAAPARDAVRAVELKETP